VVLLQIMPKEVAGRRKVQHDHQIFRFKED
jgi:hypothetical protein